MRRRGHAAPRAGRILARAAPAVTAAVALVAASVALAAAPRSGNPPTLVSARIDAKRQLVVTYRAPDGVTYGGRVYLDADPRNATPVSVSPQYGPIMYCNNISRCAGRWQLTPTSATGPFTFSTEPLDATQFPPGTYYVQVETTNEDPYPSTRMWEFSNILTVQVPAAGGRSGGKAERAAPAGPVVGRGTLTGTATVTYLDSHGNAVEDVPVRSGPIVLYRFEDLEAYAAPVRLALKEGRLVIAPHSVLSAWGKGLWGVEAASAASPVGTAWFSGRSYKVVAATTRVTAVGDAEFTVETDRRGGNDRVRVYSGKVKVEQTFPDKEKPETKKPVVLTAGFETIVAGAKAAPAPPAKFTPPARKFWK